MALFPYLIGKLFDAILEPSVTTLALVGGVPLWLALIGLWFVIQIAANGADWIIEIRKSKFGNKIYGDYISAGFARLLKMPLSFHADEKRGEIGERINRAANRVVQIVENVLVSLSPQFLSVAVGLSLTFVIRPLGTLILIVGVSLYVLILLKVAPPAIKLQEKSFKAWRKAYGDAYDTLYNVHTVKQSTAESYEEKKLHNQFVSIASKLAHNIEVIWGNMNFYQRVIVTITQLSIIVISITSIQSGAMTIGELIALNGYAALVFGPFVTLGQQWQNIQNGLVAIEAAEEMLQSPTEKYTPAGAKKKSINGSVTFKNVVFSYKEKKGPVLHDLTFSVAAREKVALVGESGVGKSTTIELLSGYYFPDKGEIELDGIDVKKFDLSALRRQIAVVPQEPVLFNDSIKMNIRYGRLGSSDKKVIEAAKQAHAHDFVQEFPKKYAQLVGERGIKLSVGQKQRIAIARAILRDPKILILDEPTSALDAKTEQAITESLEKLMEGRTTFIIAHRLSTVRKADKILVFDKGRIVEEGKHEDLIKITEGVYRRLYEYQIGLHA